MGAHHIMVWLRRAVLLRGPQGGLAVGSESCGFKRSRGAQLWKEKESSKAGGATPSSILGGPVMCALSLVCEGLAQQTQEKWDFQLVWEEGRELGAKRSKALSLPSLSCAPPE